jgi:hypothetical protein
MACLPDSVSGQTRRRATTPGAFRCRGPMSKKKGRGVPTPGRTEQNVSPRTPPFPPSLQALGRAATWLAGFAAVAVVALYLRAVLPYELNPYDEGVIAYGAEQVLKGRRPGVDFYVPYSPAAFYAVAAAFRLAGVRLLVERGVGAALILGVVALGFALIVRRPAPERIGGASLALAAVTAGMAGLLLSVGWVSPVTSGALALLLLTGLAVTAAVPGGRPRHAFLAGLTIGLTMLWRLDFGFGALGAAGLTWLLRAGPTPPAPHPLGGRGAGGGRSRFLGALTLCAGAALVAVPPFAMLLAAGGRRAIDSLLVWPLLGTQAASLPWPPLLPGPLPEGPGGTSTLDRLAHATGGWPFYFPLLAIALAGLRLARRQSLTARQITVGTWLLAASLPMFLYANGRTDAVHILPLLTLALLLAALAAQGGSQFPAPGSQQEDVRAESRTGHSRAERGSGGAEGTGRRALDGASFRAVQRRPRDRTGGAPDPPRPSEARLFGCGGGAGGRMICWSLILGLLPLIGSPLARLARVPPSEALPHMELPGPRGAGIYPDLPVGMQYGRIVRALQAFVPPDGRIFSGTPRHDVFLTNDIMLYFLAERDAATYYWCLDAGVTTTAPVQEEMIREIAAAETRAVLLSLIAQNPEENEGARSSGVSRLDDFLKQRFRSVPYQPPSAPVRFWDLRVPAVSQ